MEENINQNASNLIARNVPVALVVGAAGFLGSNLVDELLKKRIQVVGVDDFSSGKKENLKGAVKDKYFHLISSSAESFSLSIERLDYIFIVAGDGWKVDFILDLTDKYRSKIVFVSSIELYDQHSEGLSWFREVEGRMAKFTQDKKLNARIVRLAAVYGPRMNFDFDDPLIRLIQASLNEELQKESVALDFSSRALYVEDAVSLIVKSMLSGSTAQKIFDGALLHPIKATEIKQVLLDPLWYQYRGFTPTELPPWPTPNIEKTIKILSWEPKVHLVLALKYSLSYFKDNEIPVPKNTPQKDHKALFEAEAKIIPWVDVGRGSETKNEDFAAIKKRGWHFKLSKLYLIVVLLVIFYAFIYPLVSLGWGVLTFRDKLEQASSSLSKGEFDKSRQLINEAKSTVIETKSFIQSLEVLRKSGVLANYFNSADQFVYITDQIITSADHSIAGAQNIYQGFKIVTGESSGSAKKLLSDAQIEFNQAYENSFTAQAQLEKQDLKKDLPQFLVNKVNSLQTHLKNYNALLQKGQAVAALLPELVAIDSKKSYLIVLQNNSELRPTGGFIGSFAKVDFEAGKLQKLDVNDIYAIDGALNIHVEPPKEIKEDLGQKDWFMRDSNWEPDFPTSARQIQWFYTKEAAGRVDGVIALDISAVENLLSVVGSLEIVDYNEKVTQDNLFEKSVTHAESGFFPGSQAKKNFLTAMTNQLFNKLFFLPNQNWPGITVAIDKSLQEKHILAYFVDPKLFSYLVSQNWAGALPRESKSTSTYSDFLFPVEANLGANKSNYYLDRNYQLETTIGKEGEVFQRLKVDYTNRSPSNAFPAGKYKNRMRVYLPFGSKVNRVMWGEIDITPQVTNFADYGRTAISFLLELSPKEHKSLIIDYQLQNKLKFEDGQAKYRLNVIKQPGMIKDKFEWKLTYPINFHLTSTAEKQLTTQEYKISTDLSLDRSFEVSFNK